jgi:predicted small secreted protein
VRAARARVAVLLLASLLLAACAGPEAPPAGQDADAEGEDGRTSRGGARSDEPDENRTSAVLASHRAGPADAGRHPVAVTVPPGGATRVTWELSALPLVSLFDTVEGPGCDWSRWYVPNGPMWGTCDDLPEGTHELAVVLNEPAAEFAVEVTGLVVRERTAAPAPTET